MPPVAVTAAYNRSEFMRDCSEYTQVDMQSNPPKLLLQALSGRRTSVPPIWLMRQAGRYLPEYRAVRSRAKDFLELCYTPELAAEVTMQPIRRFGFDAAILFADILLIPHALGSDLCFEDGHGPRLSPITCERDMRAFRDPADIHETLQPVYEAIGIVTKELPRETALIGFAGAPWTVATYMIAGKGVPNQTPALRFMEDQPSAFKALIALLEEATISYLLAQIRAGAEVIKIFDSWAGSLPDKDFNRFAVEPAKRIIHALNSQHPDVPVIAFPRGAGKRYVEFTRLTEASCIALDDSVEPEWAATQIQKRRCVQGNLAPRHLVCGGRMLVDETRKIVEAFSGGPHVFNLGHGITPDAHPKNVEVLINTIRNP